MAWSCWVLVLDRYFHVCCRIFRDTGRFGAAFVLASFASLVGAALFWFLKPPCHPASGRQLEPSVRGSIAENRPFGAPILQIVFAGTGKFAAWQVC